MGCSEHGPRWRPVGVESDSPPRRPDARRPDSLPRPRRPRRRLAFGRPETDPSPDAPGPRRIVRGRLQRARPARLRRPRLAGPDGVAGRRPALPDRPGERGPGPGAGRPPGAPPRLEASRRRDDPGAEPRRHDPRHQRPPRTDRPGGHGPREDPRPAPAGLDRRRGDDPLPGLRSRRPGTGRRDAAGVHRALVAQRPHRAVAPAQRPPRADPRPGLRRGWPPPRQRRVRRPGGRGLGPHPHPR